MQTSDLGLRDQRLNEFEMDDSLSLCLRVSTVHWVDSNVLNLRRFGTEIKVLSEVLNEGKLFLVRKPLTPLHVHMETQHTYTEIHTHRHTRTHSTHTRTRPSPLPNRLATPKKTPTKKELFKRRNGD